MNIKYCITVGTSGKKPGETVLERPCRNGMEQSLLHCCAQGKPSRWHLFCGGRSPADSWEQSCRAELGQALGPASHWVEGLVMLDRGNQSCGQNANF